MNEESGVGRGEMHLAHSWEKSCCVLVAGWVLSSVYYTSVHMVCLSVFFTFGYYLIERPNLVT